MLYYLVYVSSATQLYSRADLDDILTTSHANNSRRSITGALLYKEGNLMQVLEGEERSVKDLYETIARDPRHKGAILVLQGPEETRQFGDWTMAFRDLSTSGPRSSGYSDFLNTRLSSAEFTADPSLCHRLLATFKQSM